MFVVSETRGPNQSQLPDTDRERGLFNSERLSCFFSQPTDKQSFKSTNSEHQLQRQAFFKMNFQVAQPSNGFNYSSFSYTSAFEPLTIQPVTTPVAESIWSPFSTPSLSPFQEPKASFQYSTYSPSPRYQDNYYNCHQQWSNAGYADPWAFDCHARQGQQLVSPITAFIAANSRWVGGQQRQPLANHTNPRPITAGQFVKNPATCQQNVGFPGQSQAQGAVDCSKSAPRAKGSLPKRSEQIDMGAFLRAAAIKKANGGRPKMCTFCKTNNESEAVYTSHSLKDANDKITCPVLLQYSCPECGATGEKTHTRKYCPVLQKRVRNEMLARLAASSNKENRGN